MWEKEDEGEEEEREEKDCHEARERESPAGARVGIRIWEAFAFVVVAPVAPVPLHGTVCLSCRFNSTSQFCRASSSKHGAVVC